MLDVFPIDQQEQIRIMVSESLRGIISQQLIPRADGEDRVLALETLTNTPAVANVIREAKTYMLPGSSKPAKNKACNSWTMRWSILPNAEKSAPKKPTPGPIKNNR